ncbi:unnamed protein product, partial [Brenthis ino]
MLLLPPAEAGLARLGVYKDDILHSTVLVAVIPLDRPVLPKEHRKMRLFYRYSIFSLIIYILGFIISTTLMITDSYFMFAFIFGLFQLAIFMWIIVIQMYVLILVRSEVVKLKRNMNFEFVNHAAEPDLPSAKVDYVNAEDLHY